MLDLRLRLKPNAAEVAAKVIDGEAIIMNLANGLYFSMDRVGALIWEKVEEGRALGDIVSCVTTRYDVAADRASADIDHLVSRLVEESLVEVVPGDGEPVPEPGPAPDPRLAYEPPELKRYDDMVDLLALDPPMPGWGDVTWQDPGGGA